MHQKRAISPIISIITLLLITIAIAGAGYSYLSVYWTGLTGKQIQVTGSFCMDSSLGKVVIKNIGIAPVGIREILVRDKQTGNDITSDVFWSNNINVSVSVLDLKHDMVLELRFDEGSGTEAKDTSGQGNHGALLPSGSEPTWTEGKISNGLSFDGVNDYISVAHDDVLNSAMGETDTFTISSWIKPTSWVNYGAISKAPSGCWSHSTNALWTYSSGFRCVMGDGNTSHCNSAGSYIGTSSYAPSLNKWHHVICTGDGTNLQMYVDGVAYGSAVAISGITETRLDNTNPLIIGKRTSGSSGAVNGTIDEVMIFNRSLSQEEAEALADAAGKILPGKSAIMTHTCSGMCIYKLLLDWNLIETSLQC